MTRIHILTEAEMTDDQKSVVAASKAAGKPHGGPFWAYVRNPKLMTLVQDVSSELGNSTISKREAQIAVLTVARFWSAKYPWAVQCRGSLAAGVTQDEIDAINARQTLSGVSAREAMGQTLANELLANHGLADATYKAAEELFTTEELVALVARIGSFCMTCCTANAFDITPPDDAPDRLK
jgi:4-carboxymuconolactone decarboxylase